ncbi:MAG: glycosyltransferase family 2 protein [Acidobacteria bacterium]|nr:glycosyltransferase family 2 protein [Acidobacteriota bacterium]
MIDGKKVVVILPAYNAARTLRATYADLPHSIVDEVLLVDDASTDATASVARELGIRTIVHPKNLGYGGNQKTCYREALRTGADIVVMVHPDYQYTPRLVGAMAWMISSGEYDVILGSRILGGSALAGGMPLYKYIANRFLTAFQNLLQGSKLSEFHTGLRAFSRRVLEALPLEENSNDFLFDNQVLAQAQVFGFRIGEISCPTRYFPEASSINFVRSVQYGFGVLRTALEVFARRHSLAHPRYLSPSGRKLEPGGGKEIYGASREPRQTW